MMKHKRSKTGTIKRTPFEKNWKITCPLKGHISVSFPHQTCIGGLLCFLWGMGVQG